METPKEFNISAEEMVQELMERNVQLNMEIAAKNIIIRKLQAQIGVPVESQN